MKSSWKRRVAARFRFDHRKMKRGFKRFDRLTKRVNNLASNTLPQSKDGLSDSDIAQVEAIKAEIAMAWTMAETQHEIAVSLSKQMIEGSPADQDELLRKHTDAMRSHRQWFEKYLELMEKHLPLVE